jgi:hypothetical protein
MICDRSPSPQRIDSERNNTPQEPAHCTTYRTARNLSLGDVVKKNEDYSPKDGATDRNGLVAAVLLSR